MVPALIADPRTFGRRHTAPPLCVGAASKSRAPSQLRAGATAGRFFPSLRSFASETAAEGTTCFSEVVPLVVPLLSASGDVNQGGEMHVLARELDAFDASVVQLQGIGGRVRAGE